MKQVLSSIFFFSITMIALSCVPQEEKWTEQGLKPIYVSPDDFSLIFSESPKESVDQGSSFEIDGYIYINEVFKGIHVFDNSDPANVSKVFFWNIPGNSEFTVDGDFLYADNSRHLLTINISDPANIKVVSHLEDFYTPDMANNNFPPDYQGRFECVEFEKGIVVDWESDLLNSPRCYIF